MGERTIVRCNQRGRIAIARETEERFTFRIRQETATTAARRSLTPPPTSPQFLHNRFTAVREQEYDSPSILEMAVHVHAMRTGS